MTYESLQRRVGAGRDYQDPRDVRSLVKKLRRKLGDDATNPARIFTERGVGYRRPRPDEP
ncbi:MAG: helix-turn-helix domain-containing protein [Rhodospirillales bacterium]|nr:helix-turn-helix domain-containing protein [Rhodospirillales bacterium]